MPTIHFIGKILPATHYKLTTQDLPQMKYEPADKSFTIDISIAISDSTVDVKCVMDRLNEDIRSQALKIGYDYARATVNLFCFASGINLSVVFDESINENGIRMPFVVQHLNLAPLCTSFNLQSGNGQNSLDEMIRLVFVEPALWLALDTLISATSIHSLMLINSARVVEGLRRAMAKPEMTRSEEWDLFRINLQLTKDYLRLILENSTDSRHGDTSFTPGTITAEVIQRSHIIMDRFLHFRKRKNQPLDAAEFPLLDK